MTDYTNDIERYLSGEMTAAEMQALEKKALSDPFLAEALEGASVLPASDFAKDVAELNKKITEQSTNRQTKQKAQLRWLYQVAAGLLLAVAAFTTWQFLKEPAPDTLALNEIKTDPLTPADDKKTQQELPAETASVDEQAGSGKGDEAARTASAYPAGAKSPSPITEEKETYKALETPAAGRHGAPVLAEAPKAEVHTGPLSETEKAVELAVADKRQEESKLEKNDQLADDPKRTTGVIRSEDRQKRNVIQGKVTSSEDGSPLLGVNVVIKGSAIGTVTDSSGNFQLASDLTSPSLVFSFIGLRSQEVTVGEQKQVNVQMFPDAAQLSEVVVTGYGIQREDYPPVVQLAHPVTGNRAFRQYLEKNIRYPKEALDKKVEGLVTVEFTVEPNGTLTNFVVIRGIGAGCDGELIRLVQEGPKWEPTRKDGIAVRDKVRVRLKFDLPKK